MKNCIAPALVLVIVAALLWSRSVFVAAQQPGTVEYQVSSPPPLPTATVSPGDLPLPVASRPPAVATPAPPTVSTLDDLVRALKDVRQKKADLQQQEEKLTTAIRQKIEQERKVHEEVLQMLDASGGESPRNNGAREQRSKPDDRDIRPK
jgi:hypothetical protein